MSHHHSTWRQDKLNSTQRGYGYKWQQAREAYLRSHPLCVFHRARGQVVEATVVDHKIPHRGDTKIFWDRKNWQALCKPCHDRIKQALEKSGRTVGCDVNGIPLNAHHHWNTKEQ